MYFITESSTARNSAGDVHYISNLKLHNPELSRVATEIIEPIPPQRKEVRRSPTNLDFIHQRSFIVDNPGLVVARLDPLAHDRHEPRVQARVHLVLLRADLETFRAVAKHHVPRASAVGAGWR